MRVVPLLLTAAALLVAAPIVRAQETDAPDRAAVAAEARQALELPDAIWDQVLEATDTTGGPIGYSSDEMRFYGGREHLLRSVENLFRDARRVPRETGRITDRMIAAGLRGEIDRLLQQCWGLLDLPAGRRFPRVPTDGWGVEWVSDHARPALVFQALALESGIAIEPPVLSAVDALPADVQRLVARISIGAYLAQRWMGPSTRVDISDLRRGTGSTWTHDEQHRFVGPWRDEEFDQSATEEHHVFRELRDGSLATQAYASVIFAAHLRTALEEWQSSTRSAELSATVELPTVLGKLVVRGAGSDTIRAEDHEDAWCVIDVGGNDTWSGSFGGSSRLSLLPVALALDLGGDDTYTSEEFGLGCGARGIGVLVDLDGSDRYHVTESGLGCGWFGTGLLWDLAGDDEYVVEGAWGQGAAHAGVGVLLDVSGNDRYECAEQSQGLGSTLGTGLLLDLDGDDVYHCRDDGNISELYLGQSVAMAQGCGYGRRADLGDGRSLAGGWGLLVDLAGDDRYHAQCWAQGAGYWWGVGVLEDRGGNDVYENGKYSAGAAAHFAIGVLVDVAGDDRHNQGVTTTKNQFQGHARDGSIGVFVDGGGNDRYLLKNLCAGGADLASVALFWDRAGDDVYETQLDEVSRWARPAFGAASWYDPMRSFRDDLASWGVFLDTGGSDTYPEGGRAGNGSSWTDRGAPNSRGFGLDID